jgi:hypothetical protein
MQNIHVLTVTVAHIPLFMPADIEFGTGRSVIERYENLNNAKIEADLAAAAVLSQHCRRSRRCLPHRYAQRRR